LLNNECLIRFLDPDVMEQCFIQWTQSLIGKIQEIVAIDGKTLRGSGEIYCARLENWNFGKAAAQIFCLERATIVRVQGASEDKKFAAEPTQPNSNFQAARSIATTGPVGFQYRFS
jgi:hypothetical protein